MVSKHYKNQRHNREKFIKRHLNNDGNIIDGFIVDKGHKNGAEIHTLTDNGIYLIKNCNSNTALNSPINNTTEAYDMFLFVNQRIKVADSSLVGIYQQTFALGKPLTKYRYYYHGTTTWNDWVDTLSASTIKSGTFPAGVSCNTPTADAHLVNKAYVDDKADEANVQEAVDALAALKAGEIIARLFNKNR